ncbi:hypothetical protein EW146_g5287 [Bondarzewia mesenterica]|uniref:C2H2-type domain-containing protein n=1 Tax=Bondarzewia mesenterica TaxID=1095465 RepID=A0A4S4LSK9_9AGAM|nr:hypothetical protein EW146_g5287 [Bondarzewia mesenterica]
MPSHEDDRRPQYIVSQDPNGSIEAYRRWDGDGNIYRHIHRIPHPSQLSKESTLDGALGDEYPLTLAAVERASAASITGVATPLNLAEDQPMMDAPPLTAGAYPIAPNTMPTTVVNSGRDDVVQDWFTQEQDHKTNNKTSPDDIFEQNVPEAVIGTISSSALGLGGMHIILGHGESEIHEPFQVPSHPSPTPSPQAPPPVPLQTEQIAILEVQPPQTAEEMAEAYPDRYCLECKTLYSTKFALRRHLEETRIHDADDEFWCEWCDKGFLREYTLAAHMDRFTSVGAFRAVIDLPSFSDSFLFCYQLDVHMDRILSPFFGENGRPQAPIVENPYMNTHRRLVDLSWTPPQTQVLAHIPALNHVEMPYHYYASELSYHDATQNWSWILQPATWADAHNECTHHLIPPENFFNWSLIDVLGEECPQNTFALAHASTGAASPLPSVTPPHNAPALPSPLVMPADVGAAAWNPSTAPAFADPKLRFTPYLTSLAPSAPVLDESSWSSEPIYSPEVYLETCFETATPYPTTPAHEPASVYDQSSSASASLKMAAMERGKLEEPMMPWKDADEYMVPSINQEAVVDGRGDNLQSWFAINQALQIKNYRSQEHGFEEEARVTVPILGSVQSLTEELGANPETADDVESVHPYPTQASTHDTQTAIFQASPPTPLQMHTSLSPQAEPTPEQMAERTTPEEYQDSRWREQVLVREVRRRISAGVHDEEPHGPLQGGKRWGSKAGSSQFIGRTISFIFTALNRGIPRSYRSFLLCGLVFALSARSVYEQASLTFSVRIVQCDTS